MTHTLKAGVVAIAAVLALAACGEKTPDTAKAGAEDVLVKVDGKPITQETVEFLLKEQVPEGTPLSNELLGQAREHLVQRTVLLEAAHKAGLDKQADVQRRMDFMRDEVLVQAYLKDWVAKHPVTDEKIKAEIDRLIASEGGSEYHARHILVETEAEARAIIEKLGKGAKFADLAKASKDPGSAAHGGDLGWARPATYVPEFAAALKALEKGKFTTEPVKSQFGYHVILLEDSRPIEAPPLEAVKPQLQQGLQQQELRAHIDALKQQAKIEEIKPLAAASAPAASEPAAAASQ
ncbi:MAG: peptidylprolyl isomerase [Candidatus Dactylopiibacterium sp.]|nr:peptidylprolyl isomerase [Candidatus Dactylopiibacterium sp.]